MIEPVKGISYYIIIFKNMFLSPYINQQSINQLMIYQFLVFL